MGNAWLNPKLNSFQLNGEDYLQKRATVMGTKTAVSFTDIFMAEIKIKLILQSNSKLREWERHIHDVFYLWDYSRKDSDLFIAQANKFHPTS